MAFENALAIKPNYDEAKYRLAEANNRVGKYEESLKFALEVLATRNSFTAASNYEAGKALQNLGRKQEALTYFREAAKDRRWRKTAEYEIETIQKGL